MNKKLLFILLLLVYHFKVLAQIGIGTSTPNSSANLDIDVSSLASKKGLLLPRVALQNNIDVITIPNPAVGLIVFNTEDSGTIPNAVEKNTFYYWNGIQWTNISTLTEVRRELLPQVFFIAEINNGITTQQFTNSGTDNINVSPVVVKFIQNSVILNTGSNVTLNDDYTFTINNSGSYEVSGFINYNPSLDNLNLSTNVEFIIQINDGTGWKNVAKTVGVWGAGTTRNNRTNNIPPVIFTAEKNNLIRCLVFKTQGSNHTIGATISAPTGLQYGKVLKIQKLD